MSIRKQGTYLNQDKRKESNQGANKKLPVPPNAIWQWLLPELKSFRSIEQAKILSHAKDSSLQSVEMVILIVWLVTVTAFGKWLMNESELVMDATTTLLVNLFFILPMLAIVFVPIHIRRIRRGVHEQRLLIKKDPA